MKQQVYSILDVKSSVFSQPFFMVSKGVALRNFGDLVNDPQTTISKHPSDFKLYFIGEFDDNSGGLSPLAQPEFICSADDFVLKDKK